MKGHVRITQRDGKVTYQFGRRFHDGSKVSEASRRRMERAMMYAIRWTERFIEVRVDKDQAAVGVYIDPDDVGR